MTATWIAFLAYAAAAIGLGWRARQHHEEGSEFWTAGRGLGAASVGLSISAGFLSVSWSCVYAVQLFYWYGLGAVWLVTVPWLLALAGIHLLARHYHALPAFSQPEMVGRRFGRGARALVAAAVAFVFLVWGGAEIYVAARLLSPQMGLATPWMVLLISLTVGVYATLGGFRAVVDTDKLQYTVVVLYILAMAALAYAGLAEAREAGLLAGSGLLPLSLEGARSGLPWTRLLAPGAATVVLTFLAYIPGWLFETDLWLRVQAARDGRAARRGVVFAALNGALFVGLLPLFIGVAGLALFPAEGGVFPPEVGFEGDALFAALVERYAPAWLAVLVAVGLVAAAMSTIDTCVNVMALSLAYDLGACIAGGAQPPVAGRVPRGRSAKEPVRAREARLSTARSGTRPATPSQRFSRLATAGSVAAATLFALGTESLWDIFYLSSGVLSTAVAFPVAAVFLPRVGRHSVVWSSAAGLAVTVAAYFLETRGLLAAVEPAWLAETGVGFILWGLAAAALGALAGQVYSGKPPERSTR